MQENVCVVLYLWKFNQRKLKRKYWDRHCYTNYKFGLTWKTRWVVPPSWRIIIIWPHLGRQFHLPSKFTCLVAGIVRQRIGCRNRMAWQTKSLSLLTDHNMFWTYWEARQTRLSQPFGANTVATWIDTITIAALGYHASDLSFRCIDIVNGL